MERESWNAVGEGVQQGRWRKIAGALLAVMGFFWLAKRAGWLPMDHGVPSVFWPLVVIAIGLSLFFARNNRPGRRPHSGDHG
jgi:hypothetical protein